MLSTFERVYIKLRGVGFSRFGAAYHASSFSPDVPIEAEACDRVGSGGQIRPEVVGVPAEKVSAIKRRVLI